MYNKLKVYIAACLGMAFFGVAFIVMGAVLPELSVKYQLDSIQAASLVTFLPIGVLLGSLIFGPIADHFGYKTLLAVSTLFAAAGLVGLSFFDHLALLRCCIFLIGFGGGMLNGSTNALVSDIFDDQNRSARLSFLGACYGIGALLIPLLLGTLSRYYSSDVILCGTAIVMLSSVIYFMVIPFPIPVDNAQIPFRQMFGLLKKPLILILSFFLFFQSGLEGVINNWTTTFLANTDKQILPEDIVFVLTFFVAGITLARLLLTRLLALVSHTLVLLAGILLAGVGVIGLSLGEAFSGIAFSLFLCGAGLAAGFPVIIGLIGSIFREIPGSAIGIALFIALSGNSLLNYLTGFITRSFGIDSFPITLLCILFFQALIVISNKRTINSNS